MITADGILNSTDSKVEKVSTPEWGGDVYVRIMSGKERDQWELTAARSAKDLKDANIRAGLCVVCLCDETGKRLFKDEDLEALGQKSSLVLNRIFNVARRLNKLTDADLEELEGN